MTSEEKRELERLQKPIYNSVRQAAEVHRQVGLHDAYTTGNNRYQMQFTYLQSYITIPGRFGNTFEAL